MGARQYSPWALVRRLLARHRATAVVGAALLVALVAGAVAVMVERNHTAVERDRATADNNRLRLRQAEAMLERDPTAAMAWLKTHRVDPHQAGQAVEVAARAEAAGVARHVLTVAGDSPQEVCLSSSGQLAGVIGRDGAIWLFNLARGTRRQLGKLPEVPRRCLFADDNRQMVAAALRRGGLMSARLPDGPARPLAVPGGDVAALRALGNRALLVTGSSGRAHVVPLDGGESRALPNVPAGIEELIPTADGGTAYGLDREGGLWQIDLEGGPAARVQPSMGRVRVLDVSADGRQLAIATDTDLAVRDVATGLTRWRRSALTANAGYRWVNFVGGGVIALAGNEIGDALWWDVRGDGIVVLGKQPSPIHCGCRAKSAGQPGSMCTARFTSPTCPVPWSAPGWGTTPVYALWR